jgi:BirA family biotin operon repressor/biotin-[acetyl-CoA-carboxylase] ligase
VLRLLLAAPGEISGQAMGDQLKVSRAAVAKAVATLREQQFVIEAKPRAGYHLVSEPKDLLPVRVEARLTPGGLGSPLLFFDRIDSTNLEGRRRAEADAPNGACLCADQQSAGRGRLGRRWQAPPGTCLLFSLILRPDLPLSRVFGLTLVSSLAVCRALEAACGLAPHIKWPNDVYLEGKKLAGILSEFTSRADRVEYVVLGIGLNVNLTPAQLGRLDQPAHSLRAATGKTWDRALILAAVLNELSEMYAWHQGGREEDLRQEYNRRSWLNGREVEVRDGDRVLVGKALGLAPDGGLLLEKAGGQVTRISHGDVSVLRVGN